MLIKKCYGYELEKAKPNTSEDFFNRSEVVFTNSEGEEKVFHLLYVRYFEEIMNEFVPFKENPVFHVQNRDVLFSDLVGVCALITHPEFKHQKRVYINNAREFKGLFEGVDFQKVKEIFETLESKKEFDLQSSIMLVKQGQ